MASFHTGKTFSDLLNGARMDRSKELLKDPALRICDVAEQVGFQDLAHFSRVFKKLEGMSAGEYRNTHWGTEQHYESILCVGLLSCKQSGGKHHIGTGYHEAGLRAGIGDWLNAHWRL